MCGQCRICRLLISVSKQLCVGCSGIWSVSIGFSSLPFFFLFLFCGGSGDGGRAHTSWRAQCRPQIELKFAFFVFSSFAMFFLGHFSLQGLDVLFHLLVRLFFMSFNFLHPLTSFEAWFEPAIIVPTTTLAPSEVEAIERLLFENNNRSNWVLTECVLFAFWHNKSWHNCNWIPGPSWLQVPTSFSFIFGILKQTIQFLQSMRK